jgi:hypothetical protein
LRIKEQETRLTLQGHDDDDLYIRCSLYENVFCNIAGIQCHVTVSVCEYSPYSVPDVFGEYTYVVIDENTAVKITGIWFTGYRENIWQTFPN